MADYQTDDTNNGMEQLPPSDQRESSTQPERPRTDRHVGRHFAKPGVPATLVASRQQVQPVSDEPVEEEAARPEVEAEVAAPESQTVPQAGAGFWAATDDQAEARPQQDAWDDDDTTMGDTADLGGAARPAPVSDMPIPEYEPMRSTVADNDNVRVPNAEQDELLSEDPAYVPEFQQVAAPRRRLSKFWAFYGVLLLVLLLGIGATMVYTYESLLRYENSQPETFMQHFVDDLSAGGRASDARKDQCFETVSMNAYETPDYLDERFYDRLGGSSYSYEQAGVVFDAGSPTYTIYAGEDPFITLHLEPGPSHTRLGLLTFNDWEVGHVILYGADMTEDLSKEVDTGLSYDVSVADGATVYVNGKQLSTADASAETTILPGFEYAAEFVDVPEAMTYHLEGFITEPEIMAKGADGSESELVRTGNTYTDSSISTPNRQPEQLPVDVMQVAQTWSKLMTDDLGGPVHGVGQVNAFLIPGSELYEHANKFVNAVDITFVVGHVITGFTEESVTNCVMYNDKLFSCDVHFVKNIVLGGGEQRPDEFSNRMIFAYVDDTSVPQPGWYLVTMQAITDDAEGAVDAASIIQTPTSANDSNGMATPTTTSTTSTATATADDDDADTDTDGSYTDDEDEEAADTTTGSFTTV